MSVEFIGLIGHQTPSEAYKRVPGAFDPAVVRASAQIHEAGGFDRILIG